MANAAALINEGLWRKDREFQRLPRLAQCTYLQVLSQKDLDTAGVLTLHLDLLAKACDDLTVAQLQDDFKVLEDRRFLFVDYDTDELLIRSYVRNVSVTSPNAWRSVPKNARLVASEKIRHELATELRRLRRKDAADLAAEIDPIGIPSEPLPNPISTPSERGIPSRPHSDPPSQVPVLGHLSSSGGSVGEPPQEFCSKHMPNGTDGPCGSCGRHREQHKQWLAEAPRREAEQRQAETRRRQSCPDCHGTNLIELGDSTVRKCTHPHVQETAHA